MAIMSTDPGGPGGLLRHHGDAELAPGLLDLAVNVRGERPPPWLLSRLERSLKLLAAYPDPTQAITAVAKRHEREPDEVLVTAGGAEAFVLLARALQPRHAVCVHPSFTEPEAALRAAGHEVDLLAKPAFAADRVHHLAQELLVRDVVEGRALATTGQQFPLELLDLACRDLLERGIHGLAGLQLRGVDEQRVRAVDPLVVRARGALGDVGE